MKKLALAVVFLLSFGVGTALAAPINNLTQGQTAIGVVDSFYLEHKIADKVTIGFQDSNIYGQYNIDNNLRGLIGSRDSKIYLGAAYIAPLAPSLDGYASLIGASSFTELQVGVNYKLTNNVDLNLNYSSYRLDHGNNSNSTNLGATYKF